MRVASPGEPHLSYCTNIHPGESLAEVEEAIETHVTAVKSQLGVTGAFGVGLRLSASAAAELSDPEQLTRFRARLDALGLYVFTINGFPYGAFHGTRVKEAVYRPDWLESDRVAYSDVLAEILAALLPDHCDGSISTVPGAFRPRAEGEAQASAMAANILEHAATLFRIRERTGKLVELALEPEPCCFLETTPEVVRFFEQHLFSAKGVSRFARQAGIPAAGAEPFLRRHLGVCLDACHLAVEFEDAGEALERLERAGIRIGKVQVTTALTLRLSGERHRDEPTLRALERFSDGVYLHQVVQRRGDALVRHLDLPEALAGARASGASGASEWRVHFHVPVFSELLEPFSSTQPFLRDLLGVASKRAISGHFEVETYTWDVLPPEYRSSGVDEAMAREVKWTLDRLVPAAP